MKQRILAFLFCRRGHKWGSPVGYSRTCFCQTCGLSESAVGIVIESRGVPFNRGDWCSVDQYGILRKVPTPESEGEVGR